MAAHVRWSGASRFAGFALMLIGALDPMEGSVLMLLGSGLVALGTHLDGTRRGQRAYRWVAFGLTLFGVAVLLILTAMGGVGGEGQPSMSWALLTLPYVIGWSMGVVGTDTPPWTWVLGGVVSLWWAAIGLMVLGSENLEQMGMQGPGMILGMFGLATLVGCVVRLRRHWAPSPAERGA